GPGPGRLPAPARPTARRSRHWTAPRQGGLPCGVTDASRGHPVPWLAGCRYDGVSTPPAAPEPAMSQEELNQARLRLHEAQAQMNYHLELRGDAIARENGWTNVEGFDAVRYYLMQK